MIEKELKCSAIVASVSAALTIFTIIFSFGLPENPKEDPMKEDDTIFVENLPVWSAAGIAVKNTNGSIAMMVNQGEIEYLNPPEDTGISDSMLKAFLYRMMHMPAIKALRDLTANENYADFGLNQPLATVSIIHTDGETERLYLGDKTPFDAGWYLEKDGDSGIYIVDDITAEMMQSSEDDFRDLEVIPRLDADVALKDFTYLKIEHGEKTIELKGGLRNNAIQYHLIQPFETDLDWEKVNDQIYKPLTSVIRSKFVKAGNDILEYSNSKEDQYSLAYVIKGVKYDLEIVKTSDGNFIVGRNGTGQIVEVSSEAFPFLNMDLAGLLSGSIYNVSAADLSDIHIQTESDDLHIKISGVAEDLKAEFNGKIFDRNDVLSLIDSVTMLSSVGEVQDEINISADPFIRIVFSLRDGSNNEVKIIPVSEKECVVIIDGEKKALTYTSQVQEMLNEIKIRLL